MVVYTIMVCFTFIGVWSLVGGRVFGTWYIP